MKTLGRILIILIAALAVIGVTYALSPTTAFSTMVGLPMDEGETGDRPAPPDLADGQTGLLSEVGERPAGGPEGSGGSWETVGRNLLQMAAIVTTIQVLWSIGRWLKRTFASLMRKNRLDPSRS
jgi:hypothetical protein